MAMPIDVGEHVVVVTAPGREAKRTTVKIVEGQSPKLELSPGDASRAIEAPPPPPPPPPRSEPAPGSGRTIGIVIGSLGVASLAAGVVTGVMTLQRKSTVESDCHDQISESSRSSSRSGVPIRARACSTRAFSGGGIALGESGSRRK